MAKPHKGGSRTGNSTPLLLIPALLVGGAVGYVASEQRQIQSLLAPSTPALDQQTSCDIKGNISKSGEYIYHLPGDKYYAQTRIDESRGERWFCSESEARAAGWRHSKV